MADKNISTIALGGTTYNVVDAELRQAVETLKANGVALPQGCYMAAGQRPNIVIHGDDSYISIGPSVYIGEAAPAGASVAIGTGVTIMSNLLNLGSGVYISDSGITLGTQDAEVKIGCDGITLGKYIEVSQDSIRLGSAADVSYISPKSGITLGSGATKIDVGTGVVIGKAYTGTGTPSVLIGTGVNIAGGLKIEVSSARITFTHQESGKKAYLTLS